MICLGIHSNSDSPSNFTQNRVIPRRVRISPLRSTYLVMIYLGDSPKGLPYWQGLRLGQCSRNVFVSERTSLLIGVTTFSKASWRASLSERTSLLVGVTTIEEDVSLLLNCPKGLPYWQGLRQASRMVSQIDSPKGLPYWQGLRLIAHASPSFESVRKDIPTGRGLIMVIDTNPLKAPEKMIEMDSN